MNELIQGADGKSYLGPLYDNGDGTYSRKTLVQNSMVSVDLTFSGQIVVAHAGTPVQGPNFSNPNGWLVCPKYGNAGYSWISWQSAFAKDYGICMGVGQFITLHVANLNNLWFDVDTDGNAICFMKL